MTLGDQASGGSKDNRVVRWKAKRDGGRWGFEDQRQVKRDGRRDGGRRGGEHALDPPRLLLADEEIVAAMFNGPYEFTFVISHTKNEGRRKIR